MNTLHSYRFELNLQIGVFRETSANQLEQNAGHSYSIQYKIGQIALKTLLSGIFTSTAASIFTTIDPAPAFLFGCLYQLSTFSSIRFKVYRQSYFFENIINSLFDTVIRVRLVGLMVNKLCNNELENGSTLVLGAIGAGGMFIYNKNHNHLAE